LILDFQEMIMKRGTFIHLLAIAIAAGAAGNATAEKKSTSDLGARLYTDNCAICHGAQGKGNGPGIEFLSRQPADLTVLSKNNGGVFPAERVQQVIDGRDAVKGHGSRDMPIWGRVFSEERVKAAEYYVDVPYDMEMYVRNRILAVTDYLHRIQVK
jgi:mono/diheme cytochrome c family protein